ncbi:MAG TPA: hypothetical protein DCF63_09995 [Planctomycetaceae bacterium]|nr:hypothetical protein [Planctomycetaceae bacterium]
MDDGKFFAPDTCKIMGLSRKHVGDRLDLGSLKLHIFEQIVKIVLQKDAANPPYRLAQTHPVRYIVGYCKSGMLSFYLCSTGFTFVLRKDNRFSILVRVQLG